MNSYYVLYVQHTSICVVINQDVIPQSNRRQMEVYRSCVICVVCTAILVLLRSIRYWGTGLLLRPTRPG